MLNISFSLLVFVSNSLAMDFVKALDETFPKTAEFTPHDEMRVVESLGVGFGSIGFIIMEDAKNFDADAFRRNLIRNQAQNEVIKVRGIHPDKQGLFRGDASRLHSLEGQIAATPNGVLGEAVNEEMELFRARTAKSQSLALYEKRLVELEVDEGIAKKVSKRVHSKAIDARISKWSGRVALLSAASIGIRLLAEKKDRQAPLVPLASLAAGLGKEVYTSVGAPEISISWDAE